MDKQSQEINNIIFSRLEEKDLMNLFKTNSFLHQSVANYMESKSMLKLSEWKWFCRCKPTKVPECRKCYKEFINRPEEERNTVDDWDWWIKGYILDE